MKNFLRIAWHTVVCPYARGGGAKVRHTDAGRIFECVCDFAVWEAYS